jgi:hypothetical protein
MRKWQKTKNQIFGILKVVLRIKETVSSQKVSFIFSPTFHNHFYDFGFVYFLNGF